MHPDEVEFDVDAVEAMELPLENHLVGACKEVGVFDEDERFYELHCASRTFLYV